MSSPPGEIGAGLTGVDFEAASRTGVPLANVPIGCGVLGETSTEVATSLRARTFRVE